MKVEKTSVLDVLAVIPQRFGDERGFFCESYSKRRFEDIGLSFDFVQDNYSISAKAGTVRGLHFQAPPHAQTKLVRCGQGRLLDVAVDIRKGSPTYGQWTSAEMSFENGVQLLIPKGFLHGFVTLEPNTETIYKSDDYYAPECDGAVRFDDPEIGVDWGIDLKTVILSDKDRAAPLLKDFDSPFVYEG
jgi:dTDP-4-dehydrorhamnose 3,5-epimerase